MSDQENNSILLLMKAGNQLRSLASFTETLQQENIQLKRNIQEIQNEKDRIEEETNAKYDDLMKQNKTVEKEAYSQKVLYEQQVSQWENDNLYLQNELTAVQHLCEAKEHEISNVSEAPSSIGELKKQLEELQKTPTVTSPPSTDVQEQLAYIDNKLQRVTKQLYEVRSECEHTESSIIQYTNAIETSKSNIQNLYSLLIEAIHVIIQLRSEAKKDTNILLPVKKEDVVVEPPIEFEEREYSTSSLEYQFQCFDKQIESLQSIIDQQQHQIEELQKQVESKNTKEVIPTARSIPSFEDAIGLLKESMQTKMQLLEEENRLFKTKRNETASAKKPVPILNIQSTLFDSPKNEEKRTEVNQSNEDQPHTPEEVCKKCHEPAYGFMITCCQCNACFHISCVISKNENVSDLFKKSKKYICKQCQ